MALTLGQGVALVADNAFQARVAMAFYYVARQVIAEPPTTVGHENRERFARAVTGQPYSTFQSYAAMVVTDPVIVASNATPTSPPPDGQIIDAVTAMWNSLSGVPVAG